MAWVARVRESMARLTPRFSANRAVREYTHRYYLPATAAYRERAADRGAKGAHLVEWRCALETGWSNVRFGEVTATTSGEERLFEVQVYLGSLDPEGVRLELYADEEGGGDAIQLEMTRGRQLVGAENGYAYSAQVPATRPVSDFTPRLIPHFPGVAVPLEEVRILWQR